MESSEVLSLSDSFGSIVISTIVPSVFNGLVRDNATIDASHTHFDERLAQVVDCLDGVVVTFTTTHLKTKHIRTFRLRRNATVVDIRVEHDTIDAAHSVLVVNVKVVPTTALRALVSPGDYQAVFNPPPESIGMTPPTRTLKCDCLGLPDIPVSIGKHYLQVDGAIPFCIVAILPVSVICGDLAKLLDYVFE